MKSRSSHSVRLPGCEHEFTEIILVNTVGILPFEELLCSKFDKHINHESMTKVLWSAKKSLRLSLWLLLVPFSLFLHRLLQDIYNLPMSPDSSWPFWLRLTVKSIILIVIPLTVAVINFLSTPKKVLNFVIAIASALVALLFTVVQITDY